MAQSGGNKKSPSPSDLNYQKRLRMGNLDQIHKDHKHARHNARMGLDSKYAQNLTTPGGKPHRAPHVEKPGKGALYHRPILSKAEALALISRHAREAAEARSRAALSAE